MTWLIRMGALRAVAEQAANDPSIRKSDAPARPRSLYDIEADFDLALSSLGGNRLANMDFRSQQLAKAEAAERHQAAVRKSDEDRDAQRGKVPLVLPSEEKKRKAAAEKAAAARKPTAARDEDEDDDENADDGGDNNPPPAAAPVKDTKVKSGTSNVTHKPSDEGVYAPTDRRTVTTHHVVNRKRSGSREPAIKSDDGQPSRVRKGKSDGDRILDLADPRTWLWQLSPA